MPSSFLLRHCEGSVCLPEAISSTTGDCFAAEVQEWRLAMTGKGVFVL